MYIHLQTLTKCIKFGRIHMYIVFYRHAVLERSFMSKYQDIANDIEKRLSRKSILINYQNKLS